MKPSAADDDRARTVRTCHCHGWQSEHPRQVPFELDSDTELQDYASLVNDKLQGIPNGGAGRPRGGTPTSASLQFVGTQLRANAEDRDQIIILLTDGLPNCNDKNEYDGTATECRCTLECLSQCTTPGSPYLQAGLP